jgi:Domain of unknown function (DUF3597)
MSIFGQIASAIFGSAAHAETAVPAATGGAIPASPAASTAPAAAAPAPGAAAPKAAAAPAAAKMATTDIAVVLDSIADAQDEDLDWRKSIVDLMKLLKLDSGLKNRKALATELHFTGDMGDSAAMNVWLHKQVMTKLAENGGIVPADLKH